VIGELSLVDISNSTTKTIQDIASKRFGRSGTKHSPITRKQIAGLVEIEQMIGLIQLHKTTTSSNQAPPVAIYGLTNLNNHKH